MSVVYLKCVSCGNQIPIDTRSTAAACRYCGNDHNVEIIGDYVALSLKNERLRKLQAATDRAAVERQLARLNNLFVDVAIEFYRLEKCRDEDIDAEYSVIRFLFYLLLGLCSIVFLLVGSYGKIVSFVALLVGSAGLIYFRSRRKSMILAKHKDMARPLLVRGQEIKDEISFYQRLARNDLA